MRILVATRNRKKLDELQRILASVVAADQSIELLSLDDVPTYDEVPETGATFAENALIKAREGARHTGLTTVADDSGLTVDALNGMPGIFSARWSGRHGDDQANLELLLAQLHDVPEERRGAAFVCAAALVLPAGELGGDHDRETVVEGRMSGHLIREPKGANGFGYDPIFVPQGHQRTSAELPSKEKDALSHRGKALRALSSTVERAMQRHDLRP